MNYSACESYYYSDRHYEDFMRTMRKMRKELKFKDGSSIRLAVVKNRRDRAKEITDEVFGDCDL